MRGFAKTNSALEGTSITAYGGMDLLELVCIMSWGRLAKEADLDRMPIRIRYQNGRDQFAKVRFCLHCRNECMETFNGKLIIVAGLNNVLKADRLPFLDYRRESTQNIAKLYELLENTLVDMVPNAEVIFAPPLDVVQALPPIGKEIYEQTLTEVRKRNHLNFNPSEPKEKDQFDRYQVHMIDHMTVDFWSKIMAEI